MFRRGHRLWSLWDQTKIQKFKYLENETSFFPQIKKFMNSILRAMCGKK